MIAVPESRHTFAEPNIGLTDWIRDQFRPGFRGYCIDVGASDGISANTTLVLERIWRWMVLSVEANPYYAEKLSVMRVLHRICAVADKPSEASPFYIHIDNFEAFSSLKPSSHEKNADQVGDKWEKTSVPVTTVDALMAEVRFPRLDALCVDTEGTERDVLAGCDLERWKPKVVLVESWEQGALDDVLLPIGYERALRQVDNDGYVHRQWGVLG